jgi:copper oxidase (laccase) domain-containing protein
VHAALGPCIRQESYEVGADFRERFVARDAAYGRFFADGKPGHFQFDLGGFVVARLKAAGVGVVEDLGLDTYADETRFFSYRRATHKKEADYGRLIAAITLI